MAEQEQKEKLKTQKLKKQERGSCGEPRSIMLLKDVAYKWSEWMAEQKQKDMLKTQTLNIANKRQEVVESHYLLRPEETWHKAENAEGFRTLLDLSPCDIGDQEITANDCHFPAKLQLFMTPVDFRLTPFSPERHLFPSTSKAS